MSQYILESTDENFEADVLQAEEPVLVDFWAPLCGPCKAIAPVLEEIAQEYQSKLKVVKMNVDKNQSTPAKYGVRGIPTLLIIKNGDVVATQVGAVGKSDLNAFVEEHI